MDAYLDLLSKWRRLLDLGQLAAFHQVERHVLQLAANCWLLEAGTVTQLTKIKADYKEKLDRAWELMKWEVRKAMETATAKAKKRADKAKCTVSILQS